MYRRNANKSDRQEPSQTRPETSLGGGAAGEETGKGRRILYAPDVSKNGESGECDPEHVRAAGIAWRKNPSPRRR